MNLFYGIKFKTVKLLFGGFAAKASADGSSHGEAERDVADGDDDEGEDVGAVVAVRRLRGVVVGGGSSVDIIAACYQPASAEKSSFLLLDAR